jgi:hypothetical protein
MLHYYPRHVSSINMPIFRRKNCIHTASGIVALCKGLHSTPVESGLRKNPWYSFLEAESTPGHMILSVIRKKSPVTPPGINPGTIRIVAQCLNHHATPSPNNFLYQGELFYKYSLVLICFM